MAKVAVIGAGAWGTTIALLLAENGHEVLLWAFEANLVQEIEQYRENRQFLPGFQLPTNITVTNKLEDIKTASFCFFVVPTQFLRQVAKQCKSFISTETRVVCASKGIEQGKLKLPLEILSEEFELKNLVTLSGPNLSKEIAQGLPAATAVASSNLESAKIVQEVLMQERFRVYTNPDPVGVQLAGALKNVIAIAAGIADGLNLGNNAKSALLIRGIAEISRLGVAMGAKPETFAGLAGMGDLITTCASKLSRNHCVGEQIAQGKKLAEILKNMTNVAEGVTTCKAALDLAKEFKVQLPITEQVYQVLYKGKEPFAALNELMTRSPKAE